MRIQSISNNPSRVKLPAFGKQNIKVKTPDEIDGLPEFDEPIEDRIRIGKQASLIVDGKKISPGEEFVLDQGGVARRRRLSLIRNGVVDRVLSLEIFHTNPNGKDTQRLHVRKLEGIEITPIGGVLRMIELAKNKKFPHV